MSGHDADDLRRTKAASGKGQVVHVHASGVGKDRTTGTTCEGHRLKEVDSLPVNLVGSELARRVAGENSVPNNGLAQPPIMPSLKGRKSHLVSPLKVFGLKCLVGQVGLSDGGAHTAGTCGRCGSLHLNHRNVEPTALRDEYRALFNFDCLWGTCVLPTPYLYAADLIRASGFASLVFVVNKMTVRGELGHMVRAEPEATTSNRARGIAYRALEGDFEGVDGRQPSARDGVVHRQ